MNVVYSCIFGNRDHLREPTCEIPPGVRFVLFTDDPSLWSDKWEIVYLKTLDGNPRLRARWFKLLSHVVFPEAAATLWLDANFTILSFGSVFDLQCECAARIHPFRKTVYQEIARCRQRRDDPPEVYDRIETKYKNEGMPDSFGLWMTGILFRRHTEAVKRFNSQWWDELSANSIRDQVSLPYLLKKTGLEFETWPRGVLSVHWGDHRK